MVLQTGGAEQVPKASGHWPTKTEQFQVGRLGACNNVLLILLAPFISAIMDSSDMSESALQGPAARVPG